MQGERLEELTDGSQCLNTKPLEGDSFVYIEKTIKLQLNGHYFQRIYTNLHDINIDRGRAWFMV